MKIRNFMVLAALLAVGLTSCSNDDDGNGKTTTQEGEPTTVKVTVKRPSAYASDPNATADETAINTVDIIFFGGEDKSFVSRESYTFDELTSLGNNTYSIEGVPTTTGLKEIYVGINIPAELLQGYYKGVARSASLDVAKTVTAEKLSDPTNGFTMFSRIPVESELVRADNEDYPTYNVFNIDVARLVSKVTVQKSNDLDLDEKVDGGKITDLYFSTRNVNKLVYAVQKTEGSKVIDPNWANQSYNPNDFYRNNQNVYSEEYVPVNEYGVLITNLNAKYVNENTSEMHYQWETTYASARATFIPAQYANADGSLYPNPEYTEAIPTAATFYTLLLENGTTLYFDQEAKALAFLTNNNLDVNTYAPSVYDQGYCYYNMFLNPNDTDGNEFGTLRNAFYRTTITRIYGLGNPNPWEGGDKEIPVATTTHIDVEVDIEPWDLVSDDYELSKN